VCAEEVAVVEIMAVGTELRFPSRCEALVWIVTVATILRDVVRHGQLDALPDVVVAFEAQRRQGLHQRCLPFLKMCCVAIETLPPGECGVRAPVRDDLADLLVAARAEHARLGSQQVLMLPRVGLVAALTGTLIGGSVKLLRRNGTEHVPVAVHADVDCRQFQKRRKERSVGVVTRDAVPLCEGIVVNAARVLGPVVALETELADGRCKQLRSVRAVWSVAEKTALLLRQRIVESALRKLEGPEVAIPAHVHHSTLKFHAIPETVMLVTDLTVSIRERSMIELSRELSGQVLVTVDAPLLCAGVLLRGAYRGKTDERENEYYDSASRVAHEGRRRVSSQGLNSSAPKSGPSSTDSRFERPTSRPMEMLTS
jgi:hypothetical protein